jgi:hypothetical protein
MDKSPTWLKSFGNSAIGSVAKAYESVLPIVPITINILFITSAYIFIPQVRVRWKCALLGGVVSGVMWEISKMGFGAYVFNSALRREIFLSLGAVPIFLVWLYISWVVFPPRKRGGIYDSEFPEARVPEFLPPPAHDARRNALRRDAVPGAKTLRGLQRAAESAIAVDDGPKPQPGGNVGNRLRG